EGDGERRGQREAPGPDETSQRVTKVEAHVGPPGDMSSRANRGITRELPCPSPYVHDLPNSSLYVVRDAKRPIRGPPAEPPAPTPPAHRSPTSAPRTDTLAASSF